MCTKMDQKSFRFTKPTFPPADSFDLQRWGEGAEEGVGGHGSRMLRHCMCAQESFNTKTQVEIWLVGGLEDHRYLSVTRMKQGYATGLTTNTQIIGGTQWDALDHRTTGPPDLADPPPPGG